MKIYIKIEKTVIKLGDIEIQKQKFHQHKRPISIKNIDINKKSTDINEIKYLIRSLLVKRVSNISMATKILKILYAYAYFF